MPASTDSTKMLRLLAEAHERLSRGDAGGALNSIALLTVMVESGELDKPASTASHRCYFGDYDPRIMEILEKIEKNTRRVYSGRLLPKED